jgi:hypothetical protein
MARKVHFHILDVYHAAENKSPGKNARANCLSDGPNVKGPDHRLTDKTVLSRFK